MVVIIVLQSWQTLANYASVLPVFCITASRPLASAVVCACIVNASMAIRNKLIFVFFVLYAINYVCKYGNFGVILQGISGKIAPNVMPQTILFD